MKAYSTGYLILREIIRIPYSLFYRKISVIGKENIPKNKPVIFAPNHQNALMDPLAMIFSTPKQIVFLARGDIFKGNMVIKLFNFLKILPVYRQHDGKDALKKNDAVFDESVDYLEQSGAFCLFPESIHNPHRNLRPLKKGIPRIAFMALRKTNFNLDIQIIPTGIYYQDKDSSYSYLQIQYGKPIPVSQYVDLVKENEQKAMVKLSKDMAPLIKPLIIDIEENENYERIESIRKLYSDVLMQQMKLKINDENRFKTDQFIIKQLSKATFSKKLKHNIEAIEEQIKTKRIAYDLIFKNENFFSLLGKMLLFIILFPIAFQGAIINVIPFRLSKYLRTNFIKDPQFTSSIKFVVGAFVMPIYFLLLSLLSLIFIDYRWSVLILFLLPFTSYISYLYFKKIKLFIAFLSYRNSKSKIIIEPLKNDLFAELELLIKIE